VPYFEDAEADPLLPEGLTANDGSPFEDSSRTGFRPSFVGTSEVEIPFSVAG
jgi:hypothetical protein